MSIKYTTPAQHKSNLRNVYGTFAIEGMTISKDTRSKGDTMFYPPDLIDRELECVFKNIHSKKLLAEQDEKSRFKICRRRWQN